MLIEAHVLWDVIVSVPMTVVVLVVAFAILGVLAVDHVIVHVIVVVAELELVVAIVGIVAFVVVLVLVVALDVLPVLVVVPVDVLVNVFESVRVGADVFLPVPISRTGMHNEHKRVSEEQTVETYPEHAIPQEVSRLRNI